MMMKQAWNQQMDSDWEINAEEEKSPRSRKTEDAETWNYLVSQRELNHIEKHIHRAERARGLRDHKNKLLPQRIPSEILSSKALTLEREKVLKIDKIVTKKPKVAWVEAQVKKHKERMARGRELEERRNEKREAEKLRGLACPSKPRVKEEEKEFVKVTAYPLFQPSQESPIQVTFLMEKSKEPKIQRPPPRELLSMPPFLKSQLEKQKLKLLS